MTRREFNKQETMRHIRAVFLSLYAKGGIDSFTVSALCQACGIAKSTFYLYYDDKYAVLDALEKELLEGMWRINAELAECDMVDVMTGRPLPQARQTIRFLKKNTDIFKALLGRYGDSQFIYKWKKDIERSFMGRFRAEQGSARAAGIASTIFSSSLIGMYRHWLFDMPELSEQEFAIILGNMLKYSLFDFQAFAE